MEVVINKCFGGFSLSLEAIERCLQLGMTATYILDETNDLENPDAEFFLNEDYVEGNKYSTKYFGNKCHNLSFRINPILLQVIRELGIKANGSGSALSIIDIPFNNENGWYIDEYDGHETIRECHRSWS